MRTEASVEIDRPIEDVFDFTNNHVAEWSKTVVEEEVIEEKAGHIGTTFRCVTEERGQRMEFRGTVTHYQPPHFSAIHLAGSSFNIDVEYEFEKLSGRTRVTQRSHVMGKGFGKLMLLLMGWMAKGSSCQAAADELEGLKEILEARRDQARG